MRDETAARLDTPAGRGVVFAAVLGSSLALLDGTVVNVALPHVGRDLGSGISGLQWVVNGYTLTLASLVLLGGALGDRYGRRRVFLFGVIWFGAASLLCGLALDTETLVAARFLQGVGAGLLTPGSLAIIQTSIRKEDRARAIGAWSGLGGVAAAAGPFVGGWLVDAFHWRLVFLINLPVTVLTVAAALKWAPETRDTSATGRFDAVGSLLGAIFLAGVTFALVQHDPVVYALIALGAGLAAGAAFVVVERRARTPVLPLTMFAVRQFSAINVVTFFVYAGLGGVVFFLVMQLQVVSGFTPLAAGLALLPFTALLLVFSSKAGALGEKIGPRLPLAVGSALAAFGIFLLLGVGPNANYWRDVLPGVVVLSVGMTVVVAPLTAGVLAAVDSGRAGVASGVNNAVARVASLLAVAALPLIAGLTGAAYDDPLAFGLGYQVAIVVCAGLFAVAAAAAALLVRKPAPDAPHAEPRTHCPYSTPQPDPGVPAGERPAGDLLFESSVRRAMPHQRLAFAPARAHHLADHDRVVAVQVRVAVLARQPRQ
ncbi:MAG: MFS transporter [Stackebrandtia sp.]